MWLTLLSVGVDCSQFSNVLCVTFLRRPCARFWPDRAHQRAAEEQGQGAAEYGSRLIVATLVGQFTPKTTRDNALLQMGFWGGFRRSELVEIEVDDKAWDAHWITIPLSTILTVAAQLAMLGYVPEMSSYSVRFGMEPALVVQAPPCATSGDQAPRRHRSRLHKKSRVVRGERCRLFAALASQTGLNPLYARFFEFWAPPC